MHCKSRKAQGLIEFMVLGAVLIFLLSSIIANAVGSVIETRQKANLLKKVLRASVLGGFKNMQASFVHVEDRIAAGVSRYGEIDRNPLMFAGSGTLSMWLYYTPDEDEKEKIHFTPHIVNGKQYNIPSLVEEKKEGTMNSQAGLVLSDGEDAVSKTTEFCKKVYKGTSKFDRTCRKCFDLQRIGAIVSDRIMQNLTWQWQCFTAEQVFEEFQNNLEQSMMYDLDGDLNLETITAMQDLGNGNYQISFQRWTRDRTRSDCVTEGFRTQSQILTRSDGISLSIQENPLAEGKPRREVKSHLRKNQIDVIERQYQINRGVRVDVSKIGRGIEICRTGGEPVDVCKVNADQGCCFDAVDSTRDCLDTATNILYMRSIIHHKRQSLWQQERAL